MAGTNRTGRVSSIDYAAGTYEVVYYDRGQSVTKQINAMSNGEYKMPTVGQIVSVSHNSNGTAAACSTGTVWNKSNKPAEGYEGLYRKEYGNKSGQAYERYDENTGVYTQYTDKRTGRNTNGEIYDEAKGPITIVAAGQIQIKTDMSFSVDAKVGANINAEKSISIEAGTYASIEAVKELSISIGKTSVTIDAGGNISISATNKISATAADSVKHPSITNTYITIDAEGNVTVSADKKLTISAKEEIEMEAPKIGISGANGTIEVNGISLTEHTHESAAPGEQTGEPE